MGSVQELLHKLRRAEATVQGRNRHGKEQQTTSQPRRVASEGNSSRPLAETAGTTQTKGTATRQGSEMNLKHAKCQEKGHLAKSCPQGKKKGLKRMTTGESMVDEPPREEQPSSGEESDQEIIKESNRVKEDPWLHTMTVGDRDVEASLEQSCAKRGPTYKVDLVVDDVKTRGFLDHGVQESLVRKELQLKIQQTNNWSLEESHKRNLEMGTQPVGAAGIDLGTTGLVALQVLVDETGVCKEVPCHVLASEKPIFRES